MIILSSIVTVAILLSSLIYLQRKLSGQRIQIKNLALTNQDLQHELIALQDKMREALEDPLTHLPGWRLFEDRLNQQVLESQRYQLTLALLFVEINDFNSMDETLGHEAGNKILIEVGKRLNENVRSMDSVSRYTRDIFVVMLPRLNKPESAAIVVQRILQAMSEGIKIKDQTLTLSTTIGVAIYPLDGQNIPTLLRNADHALQVAKENHLVCQYYHEQLPVDTQREFLLSSSLKSDDWMDELLVDYQPIYNTEDKTTYCMTASLVWQHPVLGRIQSEELLAEAERQGKARQFILRLLEKMCQQNHSPTLLNIAIPLQQLQNSQFVFDVSKILQACQFDPSRLLIEIRNTSKAISWDVLEKSINMLKYLKIKLAVSDFGPNAFSMSQLKRLSLDYLVIDNTAIHDIENNPATQHFIRAVHEFARSLSMQIMIRHVESRQQMEILQGLGCHLVQGEFVSQWLAKEMTEKI